jgi:phosphatidylserine/phosphatidylglycerophosphate/cardiolipin synthase-like enzyme
VLTSTPAYARLLVRLILTCALAVAAVTGGAVPAAAAGSGKPPARGSGSVRAVPILNSPKSYAKHYVDLAGTVGGAIRATRRGDTIHAAYYLFDLARITEELVAAHRRGVHVKLVVARPSSARTTTARQVARLARVLGTDRRRPSYVFSPVSSGLSRAPSANLHAKVITFSRAGQQRYISFVGSGNLNYNNTVRAWNETQTVVGDRVIYRALARYVEAIAEDRARPHYYRKVRSHGLTIHLFPGAPDIIGRALRKAKPGRTCRLTVATFRWTDNRLAEARKVARLARRGCQVRVLVNATPELFGTRVAATLRTAGVPVRNAHVRHRGLDGYLHTKTWIINGTVYAGSANSSARTRRMNADVLTVRTSRNAAGRANLAAYQAFLDRMWSVARPIR